MSEGVTGTEATGIEASSRKGSHRVVIVGEVVDGTVRVRCRADIIDSMPPVYSRGWPEWSALAAEALAVSSKE